MPSTRVELSLNEKLTAALDEARGFEPRASFVKRALESALSDPLNELEDRLAAEGIPRLKAATRALLEDGQRAPVEKEPVNPELRQQSVEIDMTPRQPTPPKDRPAHNANWSRTGKLR